MINPFNLNLNDNKINELVKEFDEFLDQVIGSLVDESDWANYFYVDTVEPVTSVYGMSFELSGLLISWSTTKNKYSIVLNKNEGDYIGVILVADKEIRPHSHDHEWFYTKQLYKASEDAFDDIQKTITNCEFVNRDGKIAYNTIIEGGGICRKQFIR